MIQGIVTSNEKQKQSFKFKQASVVLKILNIKCARSMQTILATEDISIF